MMLAISWSRIWVHSACQSPEACSATFPRSTGRVFRLNYASRYIAAGRLFQRISVCSLNLYAPALGGFEEARNRVSLSHEASNDRSYKYTLSRQPLSSHPHMNITLLTPSKSSITRLWLIGADIDPPCCVSDDAVVAQSYARSRARS